MTIIITGVKEAQKAIAEVSRELADEIPPEALEKIGEAMLRLVRARTPVRTGTLLRGHQISRLDDYNVILFNDVPYQVYVEFGTSRMEPRPHWRPAFEETKRAFPKLLISMGKDAISSAVSRNRV